MLRKHNADTRDLCFFHDCDAPGQDKKVENCLVTVSAKGIALPLHPSLG